MNLAPPQSDLVVVSAAVATVIWLVLAGFSRDLGRTERATNRRKPHEPR
jgi:hypothetical protein